MILPEVAVNEIVSVTVSPGLTVTGPNWNCVSPAAAASAVATVFPFTAILRWAATDESGLICTRALLNDATPTGTVNVCETVPPGIDRGLPGLPLHIARPTAGSL